MSNEKTLSKSDIEREFNQSDIGKLFWRVEHSGVMSQYLIEEVHENLTATFKIAGMTNISQFEHSFRDEINYWCRSNFGTRVIRSNDEFFLNLDIAKRASKSLFEEEVNPNGVYRVARYFDDMFEAYVTDELSKKDAHSKRDELNKQPRHYVSYGVVPVKTANP